MLIRGWTEQLRDLNGRGQSRLIPSSSIPENGFGREGINFVGDIIYIYNSSKETVDLYTLDGTHINSESIYDCYDVVAIGNRIYARYYIQPAVEEPSSGLHLDMFDNRNRLTLSYNVVAGIFEDNTVGWATTSNYDFNTDSWNNIISVQAGLSYLFGLKSDGTVVITGEYNDGSGPRGFMSSGMDMFGTHYNEWTDVVQIACAKGNLFGLKRDGTLVAFGPDTKWQAPLYFDEWNNLVKITASDDTIVGLKADGTVVAAGGNEYGQCGTGMITNAKDVVATATCTIVLLEDGTLQTIGELSNDDTTKYIFDGVELQDGDECFTIVDGYGGRWVIDRYSFKQHDYDGAIDIWSVSIYMNDPKGDAAAAANLYALGMNIFYSVERYNTEENIREEIAYSSDWENSDMYFTSDDGYTVTINLGVLPDGEWDGQMWSGL